jgi:hypothetical protein
MNLDTVRILNDLEAQQLEVNLDRAAGQLAREFHSPTIGAYDESLSMGAVGNLRTLEAKLAAVAPVDCADLATKIKGVEDNTDMTESEREIAHRRALEAHVEAARETVELTERVIAKVEDALSINSSPFRTDTAELATTRYLMTRTATGATFATKRDVLEAVNAAVRSDDQGALAFLSANMDTLWARAADLEGREGVEVLERVHGVRADLERAIQRRRDMPQRAAAGRLAKFRAHVRSEKFQMALAQAQVLRDAGVSALSTLHKLRPRTNEERRVHDAKDTLKKAKGAGRVRA